MSDDDDRLGISDQRRIGFGMVVVMWIMVFGLLTWFFSDILQKQINPNQNVLSQIDDAGVKEVSLKRNRQGHYVTSGKINGQGVVFMVDTGATDIAVPVKVAQRLGLVPGRESVHQTANGKVVVFTTRLESVAVGEITLNNVEASINPGMEFDEILLGMSFLKNLEFTQRGDILTLRQY